MRPKEGEREAQRAKAVLITVVLALAHLLSELMRYRNLKMTILSNQIYNSKTLPLLNASFEQISGDETSFHCSSDKLIQVSLADYCSALVLYLKRRSR